MLRDPKPTGTAGAGLTLVTAAAAVLELPAAVWITTGVLGAAMLLWAAAAWVLRAGDAQPARQQAQAGRDLVQIETGDAASGSVSGSVIQNSTVSVTYVGQEEPPPKDEREYVQATVTPEYLTALYGGHTTIQAARLLEPYMGRWMRVSGPVSDVRPGATDYVLVNLVGPGDVDHVFLFFDADAEDRLAALPKGTQITVSGQIESVEPHVLQLTNCELED